MAYISQHSGENIDEKIELVDNLQAQITSLNNTIAQLNTTIQSLQSKDSSLTSSINRINTDLTTLSNNVNNISTEIIPIDRGGSGKTTRLDAMNIFNGNYYKETWALGDKVSGTQTKNISFTSQGRPVMLIFSTCIQAGGGSGSNCWITAEFHRDGSPLKSNTQVVTNSNNDNATLVYLDPVGAGTHVYTIKIQTRAGNICYNEINSSQPNTQPEIIIFEI